MRTRRNSPDGAPGSGFESVLLPHEWAFLLLLGTIWCRLMPLLGWYHPSSLLYLGLMAAVLGVAGMGSRAGGRDRGRARLAFYYPLMLVIFTDLERTAPVIAPVAGDPLLQAWDLALFGVNPSVAMAPHLTAFKVELLSVGYCMFYVYLFGWGLLWLRESEPRAQAFYIGLFTLYAIGMLGYTLVPAQGPWVALVDSFPAPLQGYGLTDLMLLLYPEGSNGAFPSLHSGLTLFILGLDWLAGYRLRALLCLPFAVLMWIATIGLRFHYMVDVLAGLALALPCLALAAMRLAIARTPPDGRLSPPARIPGYRMGHVNSQGRCCPSGRHSRPATDIRA